MTTPEFEIDVTRQGWIEPEPRSALDDLCSHGDIRLVIGGQVVAAGDGSGDYTISTSALALLRTLESDHSSGSGDQLILHCGMLFMTSCPIGIDWSVTHASGAVHLSKIARCDEIGTVATFPEVEGVLAESEYRRQIVRFAEKAKQPFAGVEKVFTDDLDREMYEEFWREYEALLARFSENH